MTGEKNGMAALSQGLSSKTYLLLPIFMLVLVGFLLDGATFSYLKNSIGVLDAKMSAFADPNRVNWLEMSESEIRTLGGKLEATQTGNVLYFQAFTASKHPNIEKLRVPIASMTDVMTAIENTTKTLGLSHIAMSVSPEIGVYDGKLVLMGVVVTLPPATLFK